MRGDKMVTEIEDARGSTKLALAWLCLWTQEASELAKRTNEVVTKPQGISLAKRTDQAATQPSSHSASATHPVNRKVQVVGDDPLPVQQAPFSLLGIRPATRLERHELLQHFLLGLFLLGTLPVRSCGGGRRGRGRGRARVERRELGGVDGRVQFEEVAQRRDTPDRDHVGEEEVELVLHRVLRGVREVFL
jgi:hypothetical protein